MGNKLWVFGDSFSVKSKQENTYIDQISAALNLEIRNYSKGGSSLDYLYYAFDNTFSEIKENDVVLITLTDYYRVWMNREHPDYGTWGDITYEDRRWLNQYKTKFFIEEAKFAQLNMFLEVVAARLDFLNSKPVLLWCFWDEIAAGNIRPVKNSITVSKGSLYTISINEFKTEADKVFIKTNNLDDRPNHFSLKNHNILADKVINYLNNNIDVIDLTEGFYSNFIES